MQGAFPRNLSLSSEQDQPADIKHPGNWHYEKNLEDGSHDSIDDTLPGLNTTAGVIAPTDQEGSPISDFSGLGDPEFCLGQAEKDEKVHHKALPSSQRGYDQSSGSTLTHPAKISEDHAGRMRVNELLSRSPQPVRRAKRARTGEEEDTRNKRRRLLISASTTASSFQLDSNSESRSLIQICNDPNPGPSRPGEIREVLSIPSVLFALDGRLHSSWPTTVVESMFENFSRHCNVHLNTKEYKVDPVMRYSLPEFNRWYLAETAKYASTLRFSIFREGKLERGYPGCKVDSYFFHLLKQCIWDHFWETSEVEQRPPSFQIVVTACRDPDLQLLFDLFIPGVD